MLDNDGFTLVSGKKAAKNVKNKKVTSKRSCSNKGSHCQTSCSKVREGIHSIDSGGEKGHDPAEEPSKGETDFSQRVQAKEKFIRFLNQEAEELRISPYFEKFSSSLDKVLTERRKTLKHLICLGLGRFRSCPIARTQLSFLVVLQSKYELNKVIVSDPIFSLDEQDILNSLPGFQVDADNQEAKIVLPAQTLVYLPHCPKQLTNNLLWSNWSREQLNEIFILSNSFERILSHLPQRIVRQEANFIALSAEFVREISIENCFKFPDIFNDSALHFFESLPPSDWTHWREIEFEPTYPPEDLEYVQRERK